MYMYMAHALSKNVHTYATVTCMLPSFEVAIILRSLCLVIAIIVK